MIRSMFIVEDSAIIRNELIDTLEELVISVQSVGFAETEAQAVAWFGDPANAWDLAVVDLFYKHGNGLGVLAVIRARRPDQKVIVLTNYCTDAIRIRCKALGADVIFDKSTQLDDFFAYLHAGHAVDSAQNT